VPKGNGRGYLAVLEQVIGERHSRTKQFPASWRAVLGKRCGCGKKQVSFREQVLESFKAFVVRFIFHAFRLRRARVRSKVCLAAFNAHFRQYRVLGAGRFAVATLEACLDAGGGDAGGGHRNLLKRMTAVLKQACPNCAKSGGGRPAVWGGTRSPPGAGFPFPRTKSRLGSSRCSCYDLNGWPAS